MKNTQRAEIDKNGKIGTDLENDRWQIVKRAATSGTLGGLVATGAALLTGKYETGSFAAPLNATSHIIWGEEAARQDRFSLKFTFTGFMLNQASGIFWAFFYEKLFGQCMTNPKKDTDLLTGNASCTSPLMGAAAITASAYVIDYHLIPPRFTPGFEKRVSGKSLAVILAALALGLAARDTINAARACSLTKNSH